MNPRNTLIRNVGFIVTLAIFMFAVGAMGGASRYGELPIESRSSHVGPEDLAFLSDAGVISCNGTACPIPACVPDEYLESHDVATFLRDDGVSMMLSRGSLAASSCNEAGTVCVLEYTSYYIILEGERIDRLSRAVWHGRVGRIDACMQEVPTEDDAAFGGGDGFVVAHVKAIAPAAYHFNPQNGSFVQDET